MATNNFYFNANVDRIALNVIFKFMYISVYVYFG